MAAKTTATEVRQEMPSPRLLKPGEISIRVHSVRAYGDSASAIVLLYKDARVDMDILDETFGSMNWTRQHELIDGNLFCTISVWDGQKWVGKQDVGTESNTEAVKGESSDSFKRAAVLWGIGRELYTSPHISIKLREGEYKKFGDKLQPTFAFALHVDEIGCNERREIDRLVIKDKNGNVRYILGAQEGGAEEAQTRKAPPKIRSSENPLVMQLDQAVKKRTEGMTKEEKSEFFAQHIKPLTGGILNYHTITDGETIQKLHDAICKEEKE